MRTKCISLLFCYLLCCSGSSWAQQYFRLLESLDRPYEQKIARFANDDIIIGGSPIVGITADQNGGLNLSRLDKCGKVSWSMNYQWKTNYMTLKDIDISEIGDIFVYGSTYEGSSEYIFLLKLNGKGVVLAFRVFHPGTVDHFTYNIDIRNNRIMAYGLLLDFNTSKRGFIMLFDEKLNPQWSKVFEPFESLGKAIITKDNGFLGRSGFYLFRLNAQGSLQWAKALQTQMGSGLSSVAGPLEVNGGYIFEAVYDKYAFFYKIDENGNLVWKSPQFLTTNSAADLTLLPDGNLLAIYNTPDEGENFPSQVLLSPEGQILNQQKLIVSEALQTASIYQSIGKNRLVSVVGSRDILAPGAGRAAGFLLQFSLGDKSGQCFEWQDFKSSELNEQAVNFTPLNVTFFESSLRNVEANIKRAARNFTFEESCDLPITNVTRIDSVLTCGENWKVSLPDASFEWEDEVRDNPRTLERPGIYRAINNDCITPLTYEFNLQREPCLCKVYLPTAFSPNDDGQNDKLELFSNCNLQQVSLTVYNRWGNQVFITNTPSTSWNGIFNQKSVDSGLYVVVVRYQLLNDTNEMQEGTLVQNVQIIR